MPAGALRGVRQADGSVVWYMPGDTLPPEHERGPAETPDPALDMVRASSARIVSNPTAWHILARAVKACIDWNGSGAAPRIALVTLGDSVGGAAFNYLQAALIQRFGQCGAALGNVAAPITTGTVSSSTTEYAYWPTGEVMTYSAGATARYGMGGGPYNGTRYALYLVRHPGAGSATVDILDSAQNVIETLFSGSLDAAMGVQIVSKSYSSLTGTKWLRLTVNSGAVKCIGASFYDGTRVGVFPANVSKGGLQLSDAVGASDAILSAVMSDVGPHVFTWSMKEDRFETPGAVFVAAHLQNFVNKCKAGAPTADWIMVGPTSSVADAGVGIPNSRMLAESNAAREVALANGFLFVDGIKSLGSYEDLLARDPQYDGAHPNNTEYLKLFADFCRETGFLALIGYETASLLRVDVARPARLRIGEAPSTIDVADMLPTGSNNDLTLRMRRTLRVTNAADNSVALHLNASGTTVGAVFKAFSGSLAAAQAMDGLSQNGLVTLHVDQATRAVSLITRAGGVIYTLAIGTAT